MDAQSPTDTTNAAAVDDLYAGLTLPPPPPPPTKERDAAPVSGPVAAEVKRPRENGDNAPAPPPKRPKTVDIGEALVRLKTHVLVDKKFPKAARLLTQLITDAMVTDNRRQFLEVLQELMAVKALVWSGRQEFAELIGAMLAKQGLFAHDPDVEPGLWADWRLLAMTHRELFTDDTFEFARAAKQVRLRLEQELSNGAEDDHEAAETVADDKGKNDHPSQRELVQQRRLAQLMPLLRTLFARHTVPWAKTPAESVLGLCTRHRLHFAPDDRAEVDQWTKGIRDRRHAPIVARSAASEARRNVIAIDAATASEAKPKVGRSNHPLFNRDL